MHYPHERMCVIGGTPLEGTVRISGGKNTTVAIIPAALLSDEVCTIENLPDISDVDVLLDILHDLGAVTDYVPGQYLRIDPRPAEGWHVSYEHAQQLRASYYLMGALLGRCGHADVALPGGDEIGSRPIDQHVKGFEALGATVHEASGRVEISADGLNGAEIFLDIATVGGTINIMLAAVKAKGNTVIHNAAKEPHVVDLANFLNSMGAVIKGAGTDVIRIRGQQRLHGTNYAVIPDQIETGTLMIATAATRGDVVITNCIPTHMDALSTKLLELGVMVQENDDAIRIHPVGGYRAVTLKTQVYPGFPTDLQPPMSALLTSVPGQSRVYENIFDQRYRHLDEMRRMGAIARIEGRVAYIDGVPQLHGAPVSATDIRAGAALVVAGLMASGKTEIYHPEFIDRGYERIEDKLKSIGANIWREPIQ